MTQKKVSHLFFGSFYGKRSVSSCCVRGSRETINDNTTITVESNHTNTGGKRRN